MKESSTTLGFEPRRYSDFFVCLQDWWQPAFPQEAFVLVEAIAEEGVGETELSGARNGAQVQNMSFISQRLLINSLQTAWLK